MNGRENWLWGLTDGRRCWTACWSVEKSRYDCEKCGAELLEYSDPTAQARYYSCCSCLWVYREEDLRRVATGVEVDTLREEKDEVLPRYPQLLELREYLEAEAYKRKVSL